MNVDKNNAISCKKNWMSVDVLHGISCKKHAWEHRKNVIVVVVYIRLHARNLDECCFFLHEISCTKTAYVRTLSACWGFCMIPWKKHWMNANVFTWDPCKTYWINVDVMCMRLHVTIHAWAHWRTFTWYIM